MMVPVKLSRVTTTATIVSISSLLTMLFLVSILLTQSVTEVSGSRLSTTHHRRREAQSRNKREGSWSNWSSWSSCSRSCGGGIRTQTRNCRALRVPLNSKLNIEESKLWKNVSEVHCEGRATRHHLCHIQPCPTGAAAADVRESQCSSFDNRPFMGKMYQWESYIDERSPCSLTCRAKGFRFFTTLSQSVIDGASCSPQTINTGITESTLDLKNPALHVCISGICTSIGCDGIAGSQRRLDKCGVCGGDDSTCRVVSGIFTRPQLPVGYNMVAHIPRGACNLNITQIRRSQNYLSLRRTDGRYLLNGNWAISWPGEYEGVGTKFRYTRQDAKSFESIVADGPLEEPVDLLVLYQQPNPGIKYEYMMPKSEGPIPLPPPELNEQQSPPSPHHHHTRHHHRPTAYSEATSRPESTYNPNSKARPQNLELPNSSSASGPTSNSISSFPSRPSPPNYPSRGAAADSRRQQSLSLQHGQRGTQSFSVNANSITNPSSSSSYSSSNNNGLVNSNNSNKLDANNKKFHWKLVGYTNCSEPCGGGVQTSLIRCVRGSPGIVVPDPKCNADEKPTAQTTIRCNLRPCPAEWAIGPWSSCSEACGDGFQARTVHCQQRVSPTLTMRVSEGACVDSVPESKKSCLVKPCHRWETTSWSQCSATCGNGIRRRSVHCVSAAGERIGDSHCASSGEEKPLDISACNMGPCEGVGWFFSEWSNECSERCGSGIQTRNVICSGLDEKHRRRVAWAASASREIETNEIEQDDEDVVNREVEGYSMCDAGTKPIEEQQCFADQQQCLEPLWVTSPWSECSATCGQGLNTRQVLCIQFYLGKFKVVIDSQCDSTAKPDSRRSCGSSNKECPSRWFTTEWSECSAICGAGTQKRSVSCRSSNWTKASSACLDSDRPVERRSCNEHACTSATSTGNNNSSKFDVNEMVKDTPPLDSANTLGSGSTGVEAHQQPHHHHYRSRSSTNKVAEQRQALDRSTLANSSRSHPSSPRKSLSDNSGEPNEEPSGSDCTDQYRNCALVIQARLCRYKYYRELCCLSCLDSQLN